MQTIQAQPLSTCALDLRELSAIFLSYFLRNLQNFGYKNDIDLKLRGGKTVKLKLLNIFSAPR